MNSLHLRASAVRSLRIQKSISRDSARLREVRWRSLQRWTITKLSGVEARERQMLIAWKAEQQIERARIFCGHSFSVAVAGIASLAVCLAAFDARAVDL